MIIILIMLRRIIFNNLYIIIDSGTFKAFGAKIRKSALDNNIKKTFQKIYGLQQKP